MIKTPMMLMTSPATSWTLDGFFHLLRKYMEPLPEIHLFGYDENAMEVLTYPATFHSFGLFADYPRSRWSDSFMEALGIMRSIDQIFWFMMDDYWVIREIDSRALAILSNYMRYNREILKIDLATDRLYAHAGAPYLYGKGTIGRARYLDLIESSPDSPYHMSLWTGLWNIDNLAEVIVPGEAAQEIEIKGTQRLKGMPHLRVLGTRQGPVLHTNIVRGGQPPVYDGYHMGDEWVNRVDIADLVEMRQQEVKLTP